MRKILCLGLSLLALSAAGGGFAQTATLTTTPDQIAPPQLSPDDTWAETEIVVVAKFRGPAIWKLTKGDATLYILGAMPVMIKRASWDMGRVENIIKRADVFLTKPNAKASFITLSTLAATKNLGWGKTLDTVLAPDLSRRFHRLVDTYHLDAKTYAKSRPIWAALQLRDDIYSQAQISVTDPEKVLVRMAKAQGTPMRPVSSFNADPYIAKVAKFSRAQEMSCVANILSEIEFSTKYAQTATNAWGVGDLATLHAYVVNSAANSCLEGQTSTARALDKTIDDTIKAIEDNLDQPGKKLVVFPIAALLRSDGVLARLRAQGIEITEPD